MLKKIILIFILIIISFFIYLSKSSLLVQDIRKGKDISTILLLENYENDCEFFKVALIKYNLANNYIKVIFVDENITILQKTKKSKTLKEMCLEINSNERLNLLQKEILALLDNQIHIDHFVKITQRNFQELVKIFSTSNQLKDNLILSNMIFDESVSRDIQLVSLIKILNDLYSNCSRKNYISFIKKLYERTIIVETDFLFKDLILLYSDFLNNNKKLSFADVPTIYKRKRIEPNNETKLEISMFFNEQIDSNKSIQVEIFNTTNKARLAAKAADLLRENKFDVVNWGKFSKKYDFTIIIDLINDYRNMNNIKEILGCGEILFRPQKKQLADVSVLLGYDCSLYDKLDRENIKS